MFICKSLNQIQRIYSPRFLCTSKSEINIDKQQLSQCLTDLRNMEQKFSKRLDDIEYKLDYISTQVYDSATLLSMHPYHSKMRYEIVTKSVKTFV